MKDKLVILYHTNLSGNPSAGPTYSVPKQIKAQSEIDEVLWINTANARVPEWEETGLFHTCEEYGFNTLEDLPKPFDKPDVVVFESFYQSSDARLAKELRKKSIPYVIVPRGALTKEAQYLKRNKKVLGNLMMFRSFAKHAAGIQYLTEKEKADSGNKWNKNTFVIPNGIVIPAVIKRHFSEDKVVFSFIGRIAIHHKGLDLLVDAIKGCSDELLVKDCVFNIYGPDDAGSVEVLNNMIDEKGLGDLVFLKPSVHGSEKEDALLNTDVFVLTSRFEGHPMGLIEALSYGIPALVTTGSNMSGEIQSFDAGWIGETDSQSIKDALITCISNVSEIPGKGYNATILAKEYEWNKLAKGFHSLVVECIIQKNRSI